MTKRSPDSMLHLQMGQEVLYLLMTIGIMTSLILLVYTHSQQEFAAPLEQPPIITLSEARGYYFPSGSAALSQSFRAALVQRIVPRILDISRQYEARVIEVVGHTDEVPVSAARSTIDSTLLHFLNWQPSAAPVASDNVGLGMARAAAVVRELRADPRLQGLTILPLSAGQTTTVQHQLSPGTNEVAEDQLRRRIEIRVRRHFSG